MTDHSLRWSHRLATILLAVVVSSIPALAGCAASTTGTRASAAADSDVPPEPALPPPASLKTPDNAVISYIHWMSFAYRIANSDVASRTFTPWQEVRVNSYIQRNATEERRAIDQHPTALKVKVASVKESTATVTAHEEWTYRYISVDTKRYAGPWHTASYDSTYTVVRGSDGLWRVDFVEAKALGKVE